MLREDPDPCLTRVLRMQNRHTSDFFFAKSTLSTVNVTRTTRARNARSNRNATRNTAHNANTVHRATIDSLAESVTFASPSTRSALSTNTIAPFSYMYNSTQTQSKLRYDHDGLAASLVPAKL